MAESAQELREPMAVRPRGVFTRRNLLKAIGIIGAEEIARRVIGKANEVVVEEPETNPQAILEGKVRILKQGLRFRKDPTKLDVFEKDDKGHQINVNTISTTQVESFNGISYHNEDEFFIDNPEIVYGYNPDGSGAQDGHWIRLRTIRRWPLLGNPLEKRESYTYINISNQTKKEVQVEFSTGKIHAFQKVDGNTVVTDGKIFAKSDIGRITFPRT